MKIKFSKVAFMAFAFVLLGFQQASAALSAGDYYIYNDFFQKLLTGNSSGAPRLMAYDSESDAQFIFTAEASGTTGYVKLKQKSTGKYLAASTSNNYSILLTDAGSGDQYLWAVDQLFSTKIVNKKNTSARIGSDFYSGSGSDWTYYFHESEVPIYYDKGVSTMGWYSIIPSNGSGFEASRTASSTARFTNEYGVLEQDDYQVSGAVNVDGVDYHIIGKTPFAADGSVNLGGTNSWLVFENVRPSKVKSSYLSKVTINGMPAVAGTNCRVEIYMKGAVVIPSTASEAMVATTAEGTFTLDKRNHNNLGANSNKMTSFTLKRGYMATVASGTNGGGYSRVWVADHADLTVTLPKALSQRVSSVWIRNWHYTAKTGYGSTKGDVPYAATACGASWYWNWDAWANETDDAEYIPIKQHLWWPDNGNFWKDNSTAMMLFNEPEHSEQHSSCSCGGTISSWSAYTNTPQFNSNCLRIGTPSATDLSWIKQYIDYCYNNGQRCDFACTHGYWTSQWKSNINTMKNWGRGPIWITEWEYGASWTSGTNPSSSADAEAKVFDILEILEYEDAVERYAYYEFDTGGTNGWMRELFWENTYTKGLAYVGQIYDRIKQHLGYKSSVQTIPNWWVPSVSTPVISEAKLDNNKYVITVENGNGDCTGTFVIQKKNADGTWTTIQNVTDRSEFDPTTMTIELPESAQAGDALRIVVTTLFDTTELTSNTFTLADYRTLGTTQNMRFDEGVFVTKNVKTYAKDVKTESTETCQQQEVTGWTILENGDARAAGQYNVGSSLYLGASGYTAPSTNSEGTTDGGLLGLNAVWTASVQYGQYITLPRGTYTITVPVYNSTGGTTNVSKNLIGFIADNGTEYLATTKLYTKNTWVTETVTFSLLEDTPGMLSLGYTAANTGTANMPHWFVDYMEIQFEELNPNYAVLGAAQNLGFDLATSMTAKNLCINSDKITDASTQVSGQQNVTGWTLVADGDYRVSAQQAWGSGYFLGDNATTIPATDSNGESKGGAMCLYSAWNAQVQYTQNVTLPIGHYTITVPVYNAAGTTAFATNHIGFIADNGTEYLATRKTYAVGEWTTETISFALSNETSGKLSVGYTAANSGSGGMPRLYVDYMKIECDGHVWPTAGDANGDGILSLKDIPTLVDFLRNSGSGNTEFLDSNRDGVVDTQDATDMVIKIMNQKY